ncbi:MAG: hypothetical protein JSS12_11220, partial [Verrucomicrobia bacterium]|nr:hypothetical protein [Verrucomicrobiota bacterium]
MSSGFGDFQKILNRVFDDREVFLQPKFIVEVGAQNGDLIAQAFELVKGKTIRGKNLSIAPLEVVALVLEDDTQSVIRNELHAVPHRIASVESYTQDSIIKALKNVGIDDIGSVLFLSYFQDVSFVPSPFGWIQWQTSENSNLLAKAKQGWFPKDEE